MDLRYPNLTGKSEKEQLAEIRGYLYYLVDVLQVALDDIERRLDDKNSKTGGKT